MARDEIRDIIRAHDYSFSNKESLEMSEKCGCFYCLEIFDPSEICEWIDVSSTAICPYCGIDSLIGSASGYPIEKEFLEMMKRHWFDIPQEL